MTYDPVEAARLRALGVVSAETMIPAGDPIPADHPVWGVPAIVPRPPPPPAVLPPGRRKHGDGAEG